MKTFLSVMTGSLLALIFSTVALAQFSNRNVAFETPSAGDPNREYMFVVPEGVTVTTPKGKVITGGQMIGIPGKYLKLLGPKEADQAVNTSANLFAGKNQQLAQMSDAQKKDFAVVALTVPEGATIQREGAGMVKGPAVINLVVTAATLQKSEAMKETPTEIREAGFQQR